MIYILFVINLLPMCMCANFMISTDIESDLDFYKRTKDAWGNKTISELTVAGPANVSELDIEMSKGFIHDILSGSNPPGTTRVLDCGAGYGRVTKNVLIQIFNKVDMLEQDEKFANAALDLIGKDDFYKLGYMYRTPLQHFNPDEDYDVIWIQWVLMFLTDEDAVGVLERCRAALNPRGLIIVKENICSITFSTSVDGVCRSYKSTVNLFLEADLAVMKRAQQYGFPRNLSPVHMFALTPDLSMQLPEYEKLSNASVRMFCGSIIVVLLGCFINSEFLFN